MLMAGLGVFEFVRRHLGRLSALENRLDTVEDDLKAAKSARLEQMILMRTMQKDAQDVARMVARIDERTARDYEKG